MGSSWEEFQVNLNQGTEQPLAEYDVRPKNTPIKNMAHSFFCKHEKKRSNSTISRFLTKLRLSTFTRRTS